MTTIKTNITALITFIALGCAEYPNVVRLCVNHLEKDQACGTGFAVEPGTIATATHVLLHSDNNMVTLPKPGRNATSYTFDHVDGTDLSFVYFDETITDNIVPVCDKVYLQTDVVFLGVTKRDGEIEERDGTTDYTVGRALYSVGQTVHGFSGGPVVDLENNCVLAVIQGHTDTHVLSWLLPGVKVEE